MHQRPLPCADCEAMSYPAMAMTIDRAYGVLDKERWREAAGRDHLRHFPPDNDICVTCHLYRRLDAAIASYEAKVQDFAAETLRNSGLQTEIEALRAELAALK